MSGMDDAFNWIPYEDLALIKFNSTDTTSRFFKIGESLIDATDQICGNTGQDCSKTLVKSIFETDSLYQEANFVGEVYVFVSESDSFTAVVNFMDYQMYLLDPDSAMENGSGGEILYHQNILLNSSPFESVYEAQFDTLESGPDDQLVRLFYQFEKGILRFDTKDGNSWVIE